MKEKTVTRVIYEANDGKQFDIKEECIAYENAEILKAVMVMCDSKEDCEDCIFYSTYGCKIKGNPCDWCLFN